MHQDDVVLGMVHGVEDLLRRQAHVHRVQHRAEHRHGEEALQRAVAVPVEQGHGVAGLDAGGAQRVGQALDALVEGAVVVAQLVGIDDFLVWLVAHPGQQQALDQQLVVVGTLRRRNYFCRRHCCFLNLAILKFGFAARGGTGIRTVQAIRSDRFGRAGSPPPWNQQ
ncbi:hypothetical protein D3C80_1303640 [compost metagenome]